MATSFSSLNRVSGLVSGLDTESLVKAMAANTKNRLNAKKQKLQTLQWKQEGYHSAISKIQDFQDKYLTIASDTSIKANAVMNKHKAEASDSKVTAFASSTALDATYYIHKASAATAAEIKSAGSVSADKVTLDFSKNESGKEYAVKVTLDGTQHEVKFVGGENEDESKANFLTALNEAFKGIKTDDQGFEFKDGTTDLIFNDAGDDIYHTFSVGYNSEAIGLSNTTSSKMSLTSALGDIAFTKELVADEDGNFKLSINGKEFTFNKNTTISVMVNEINNSDAGVKMTFSSVTQSFKLESKTTGTEGKIDIDQTAGNLMNVLFNTDDTFENAVYGKNGTVTLSTDGVNQITYTSASNAYTFDGTTINIEKLGDFNAETEGVEPITVTTERDSEGVKDIVVKFIDDYNTLIGDLYKEINTSRPKSNGDYYDPLTEEQEEEMENDEIEKWNEQAKKGLLYQDSYISRFLSSIRTTMTSSVEGFSLSDLGITVSDNLSDYGKLIIDEDKLDSALENYGDQAAKLFTDPNEGLAAKLTSTVDSAISKKEGNYGYFTHIVGIENTNSEKKSMLYNQISSMQTIISNLEEKYENEMERYWNQFTQLETYMSQMQYQSSVFSGDSSSQ